MRQLLRRAWHLIRRRRLEADLAEEIEFHRAMKQRELEERGLEPQAATFATRRALGSVALAEDRARDVWIWPWLQSVGQDVLYAGRVVRRACGATVLAILTLGFAVAATTAVFSVVDAVLLAPLPYGRPDQLVVIWEHFISQHAPQVSVTPGNVLEWRDRARTFEAFTAIDRREHNLTGRGQPQQVSVGAVSDGFAATVAVAPIVGRLFTDAEFQPGQERVVLLGHALWTTAYGRDPSVIGQSIALDDRAYTVVGVMPTGFMFPSPNQQAWVPLPMTAADRENRTGHTLSAVGRLRDGVSVATGTSELHGIAESLRREYPASNADWSVTVLPARDALVGKTGEVLTALMAAVGLLLLVACANAASLLLTQGLARTRELAIRAAIGASRGRVIQQLLTESVLLALVAGGLGLALAWFAQPVLAAMRPADLVTWKPIGLDTRSLVFALAAAMLSGALFGTLPALVASRSDIGPLASARTAGKGAARVRQTLIAFEVALALVLVVGAAVLAQTLTRLTSVELGLMPDGVVTARVSLPAARYAEHQQVDAFYDAVLDRIRTVPGVRAAGAIQALPLSGDTSVRPYRIVGGPSGNDRPVAHYRIVTPGYLEAMRLPLREGRTFTDRDTTGGPLAVIVNDTLRRQAWGDRRAVGERITIGGTDDVWAEVVGVVGDVRHFGPALAVPAEMYWASPQLDVVPGETLRRMKRRLTLVVAADGDPLLTIPAVRAAVESVDPDEPIASVRTLSSLVSTSLWLPRASTWMLTVFGGAAAMLALLAVFAAASYAVVQRRRELAVRLALGAAPSAVVRMVMARAVTAAVAGLGIGIALAVALSVTVASLIVDVQPTDVGTLMAVSGAIVVSILVVSWLPAWRASRIDPAVVLRNE